MDPLVVLKQYRVAVELQLRDHVAKPAKHRNLDRTVPNWKDQQIVGAPGQQSAKVERHAAHEDEHCKGIADTPSATARVTAPRHQTWNRGNQDQDGEGDVHGWREDVLQKWFNPHDNAGGVY